LLGVCCLEFGCHLSRLDVRWSLLPLFYHSHSKKFLRTSSLPFVRLMFRGSAVSLVA
jgi:hypothetical protein